MKKIILFACTVVLGLCAFGPVAKADGYYRGGYYGHRHFYRRGYYRPYGFYGGPRVFVSPFVYAPVAPPVYCYPPPRPAYYEGRIEEERRPEPYDNSK